MGYSRSRTPTTNKRRIATTLIVVVVVATHFVKSAREPTKKRGLSCFPTTQIKFCAPLPAIFSYEPRLIFFRRQTPQYYNITKRERRESGFSLQQVPLNLPFSPRMRELKQRSLFLNRGCHTLKQDRGEVWNQEAYAVEGWCEVENDDFDAYISSMFHRGYILSLGNKP